MTLTVAHPLLVFKDGLYNLSAQRAQAQPCHWCLSPALVEVPPDFVHVSTGSRSHEGCLTIQKKTFYSRLGTGVNIAAPGKSV